MNQTNYHTHIIQAPIPVSPWEKGIVMWPQELGYSAADHILGVCTSIVSSNRILL